MIEAKLVVKVEASSRSSGDDEVHDHVEDHRRTPQADVAARISLS
jgi:hypothetical protein